MEGLNYKQLDINTLKNLCDEGDSKAMYYLANEYFKGENLKADREKAVDYYIKSANLGYFTAQVALINRYTVDKSIRPCFTAAYYWMEKAKKASKNKLALVRPELLRAQELIEKTPKTNPNKREKYEEAGKLGFAYGYTLIAKMYRTNTDKALPYIKLASDMGEIEALEMMINLHTNEEEYYRQYLDYANDLMKKFK